jgi:HEAT repeat protein
LKLKILVVNTILFLEKKNPRKAEKKLEELFNSSKLSDINSAIFAVRSLKNVKYIEKLRELTQHKDDKISFHASYALLELEKGFIEKKVFISKVDNLEEKLVQLLDFFRYGDILSRKLAIDEIQKLIQKEKEKIIPIIDKILQTDNDDYVLSLLVKLLGYTGSQKIIPIVKRFLTHTNSRVRANAVEGLIMLNTPVIREILEDQLLSETDSRVLNNIIIGLSKFDKDSAKEVMLSLKRKGLLEEYHLNFLEKIFAGKHSEKRKKDKTISQKTERSDSKVTEKSAGSKRSHKSSQKKKLSAKTVSKKEKSYSFVYLLLFLILLSAGGGYYYFFYVKGYIFQVKKLNSLVEKKDYSGIVNLINTLPLNKLTKRLAYLKSWALIKEKKYKLARNFIKSLPPSLKNLELVKMEKYLDSYFLSKNSQQGDSQKYLTKYKGIKKL